VSQLLSYICVANACSLSLPKLSCLGHLKKLNKLEILKIKDLKALNRDCKKELNKTVDTVQLNQLNLSFI